MKKKRTYKKKLKFRLKNNTVYAIIQLGLILVSSLIFISFFQKGPLLGVINESLGNYFGWGKFVFPFILLLIVMQFSKLKLPFTRLNILIGATLIWLTLISLFQGGAIGVSVWSNFESLIGRAPSILVLLGTLTVGLMVLFDTSFEEAVEFVRSIVVGLKKIGGNNLLKSPIGKKNAVFMQNQPPIKVKVPMQMPLPQNNKPIPQAGNKNTSLNLASSVVTNIPATQAVWEYPPITIYSDISGQKADRGDMKSNAQIIERTLESFGIAARVVETNKGPAVTQYAMEIAMGTKLSRITGLQNDLALALAAPTGQIRIEAPIPGKSLVGVEIPNRSLEFVTIKTMLSSDIMKNAKSKLTVALGLDVSGQPVVADIAKMPHVLIAGTTGSGKSVLINSWINSIIFRTTPNEVKLIMVDPKRVELVGYNGIPHLLTPVIVDVDKTLSALKWAMKEMDRRYQEFAKVGVRNIESYNINSGFQAMPYILIIIDELADLMGFAPVEVEDSICRIAQMARATGMHLILSTQRPSVDVITGLIKANIPCRIAFNVSSMIDSRVILDQPGAEKLLGRGDMLYIPPDQAKPTRIQGAFISEREITNIVELLKSKQKAQYTDEVITQQVVLKKAGGGEVSGDGRDPLFSQAVEVVCQYKKASSSFLQRKFAIGFSRAARLLDQMEEAGLVGPGEGSKPRDVLIQDPSQIIPQTTETDI